MDGCASELSMRRYQPAERLQTEEDAVIDSLEADVVERGWNEDGMKRQNRDAMMERMRQDGDDQHRTEELVGEWEQIL